MLFDFLKRLCHPATFQYAVPKLLDESTDYPLIYGLDAHKKLTMPVEFSVAAYRVGHTMVRSVYAVLRATEARAVFSRLGFEPLQRR